MSQSEYAVVTEAVAPISSSIWNKQDKVWMLSLYGTAIGAGTLFLPINAGMSGILPLLVMVVIAFPMTYFSHRALCRLVLSSRTSTDDITAAADQYFGAFAGKIITWLYFFSVYPVLLMYSVAITNTTQSFIVHQLGWASPPRAVLSLALILALMSIVRLGQQVIVQAMSFLVYPFIAVLMALAVYLIPHWSGAILSPEANSLHGGHGFFKTMWLLIPVMVFSFNHTAIISSFAVNQKQRYGNDADLEATRILKYSHLLMVGTVMFFVFSCVFSLSPHDLALAKQQNISILSYLANHFNTPVIAYVAPFIAFIAISKSFLGHYLGAREGMYSLLAKATKGFLRVNNTHLNGLIDLFIVASCWLVATLNPSILGMIEMLAGPIIAVILFLMPMYAIAKVPVMQKYRQPAADFFVTALGVIAISAILYGLFGRM